MSFTSDKSQEISGVNITESSEDRNLRESQNIKISNEKSGYDENPAINLDGDEKSEVSQLLIK